MTFYFIYVNISIALIAKEAANDLDVNLARAEPDKTSERELTQGAATPSIWLTFPSPIKAIGGKDQTIGKGQGGRAYEALHLFSRSTRARRQRHGRHRLRWISATSTRSTDPVPAAAVPVAPCRWAETPNGETRTGDSRPESPRGGGRVVSRKRIRSFSPLGITF